jgi:hypothetical protein
VIEPRLDAVAVAVVVLVVRLVGLVGRDDHRAGLFVEDRHRDDADVAGLALAAGVAGLDRREAERGDVLERGAPAVDRDRAVGRHDVAALVGVAVLAVDHVEAVDRDHRLDPLRGGVGDADRVGAVGGAAHVVAALVEERVHHVAPVADDLDRVRRADRVGRDRDGHQRPGRRGGDAVGVGGAAGTSEQRGGEQGASEEASHAPYDGPPPRSI